MAVNDAHYNTDFSQTSSPSTNNRNDRTNTVPEVLNGIQTNANNDYGIALPLPDSEFPPDPDNNTIGLPNQPTRPNLPNRPGGSIPFPGFPIYPNYPNFPSNPSMNYGQVRFLNASTNMRTVDISIDGTSYVNGAGFSALSDYDWISDGFHTITIRNALGLRNIVLQQTFPFTAGQKITMVLTDSSEGGLELIRVSDTGCGNLPSNTGCFRFANMAYNGLNVDLMLGNQTVFRNIGYQNVSNYKQAVAGSYQFTVVSASPYSYIRELPIIVITNIGSGATNRQNLLSFHTTIAARQNYTAYLIGNAWSGTRLQVLIAED